MNECGPGSDEYYFRLENLDYCNKLYAENNPYESRRYNCKLTGKLCVAEKYDFLDRLLKKASINKQILDRCPSRKELSDILFKTKVKAIQQNAGVK